MSYKQMAIQLAAQCWTDEETSKIPMDTALATAFTRRLEPLLNSLNRSRNRVAKLRREVDDLKRLAEQLSNELAPNHFSSKCMTEPPCSDYACVRAGSCTGHGHYIDRLRVELLK